jgi:hypothetical protein
MNWGVSLAVYLRFVTSERDERSQELTGIFTALYALERRGQLEPYELEWFRSAERWFNENLKPPDRLARSKRHNAARRAITWLKDSAVEHVSRMRELVALLEHKDVLVHEFRTERPGYIVYEDSHQIAAEPFDGEEG